MCQRHCVERHLDRRDYCRSCQVETEDDFERTIGTVPVIDQEQQPDAWDSLLGWIDFHCVGRVQ